MELAAASILSFCMCVGLRAGLVCLRSGNKKTRVGESLGEMQQFLHGPKEESPPVFTEGQISCGRGEGPSYMCTAVRSSAVCRCVLLCLSRE